jgi:hypothetical protein
MASTLTRLQSHLFLPVEKPKSPCVCSSCLQGRCIPLSHCGCLSDHPHAPGIFELTRWSFMRPVDVCMKYHGGKNLLFVIYASLFSPFVLHALLILLDFIILLIYLAKSTSYEAPHHAAFSTLLSLPFSLVKIFFSALCSQTPSAYAPPLLSETNFSTHTEPQAKLRSCIF